MILKSETIVKRARNTKSYIKRLEDDSVSIRSLFLCDKPADGKAVKNLCKKFGKYLCEWRSIRIHQDTIGAINYILQADEIMVVDRIRRNKLILKNK